MTIRTTRAVRTAHPHLSFPIQCLAAGLLVLWAGIARCAYKDDIGYTRLLAELGSAVPDGSGVAVTQTEANTSSDPALYSYLPDPGDGQFSGKSITDRSGFASGIYSAHATSVGRLFYGNSSSVAPGISTIDAYLADTWVFDDFLQGLSRSKPRFTSSRVANHSWIGSTGDPAADGDLLRRIDWLVERDEYIQAVGQRNNTATNAPLLSGGFNVIAVGKSDGVHGRGTAAVDAIYTPDRTRPHLVVPVGSSSSATPIVAATAALLIELGHADAGLSTDPVEAATTNRAGDTIRNAERTEVIKAVLMAGADRYTHNGSGTDLAGYRADPANRSTNGLDIRYGSGQLNVYNSYHILAAGEQNSAEDEATGAIASQGFDYDPSFGGAGAGNGVSSYYFSTGAVPAVIAATLAWNLAVAGGNGQNFTGGATLHNLDLRLYDVSGAMTLAAESRGTGDNTETIWFALEAGRDYLLQVIPAATFEWDYALAWRIDPDSDGDGVVQASDNCPFAANADQLDSDADGAGDACDLDDDNDGTPDVSDAFPLDPTEDTDTDNDGTGNNADSDDDDDGFPDNMELLTGHDPLDADDAPLWGDIDDNGRVDGADVLLAARAALQEFMLDDKQFALGDLAPRVGGRFTPDGKFNAADLLLIQGEALQ